MISSSRLLRRISTVLALGMLLFVVPTWAEEAEGETEASTAVDAQAIPVLADDRPTSGMPRIVVRWAIETATDNFGYNVYRTDDPTSGTWTKLNRRVLAGVGTTSVPHMFRYLDLHVGNDMDLIWNYKVEELSLDGARSYFSHPVTGETPFILSGKPKPLSAEEAELFATGLFVKEPLDRSGP